MKKFFITTLLIVIVSISAKAQYKCTNWEKIKSSGPDLKQIGWLATKPSKEIESSPWSVGCETIDRDFTKFSNYKKYVGELGVKSARLQGGWAKCEKEKGVYDFAWLDSCVYGLAEQDVKPWITLCYGNPLYKSELRLGAKIFTADETMSGWLRWVEATVTQYKNVVTEWEVWNEPNLENGGYEEYANLLMKTADVIKKVQPEAVIIGFSLSRMPLKFTEEVFEILKTNNKIDIVDYLSYHPYAFNPDDSYPEVEKLRLLAESYNPDIKLFQGENAAPSDNHYVYHALKDYPWTEISQAKWYLRRMAGDRVRDIRTSIFGIIDMKYDEVLLSMGLLRSNLKREVVYKKPSYYAVQHMVNIFDDTVKPVGELKFESNSARKITVAGFKKEASPIVLLWYKDEIPGDDLKWDLVDLKIMNVNYKDPVYVEMISGKVYEIDKSNWSNSGSNFELKNLPVWDSPVMISERALVELKIKTFSLYSIGNSHTWDFRPSTDFLQIAKSLNIEIKNGWHINCGQNLNTIWNNPEQTCVDLTGYGSFKNAIENYKWDAITIQTYIGGTGKAEKKAVEKFLDFIAKSKNKNSNVFIYCTWPKNSGEKLADFDYSEAWLSGFNENDTLKIISEKYLKYLESSFEGYSDKIKFIPVGKVLYHFDQKAKAGKIPGFSGAGELYRDVAHMNNVGRYIAGLTVFSQIFRINPIDVPGFNSYQTSDKWPSDKVLSPKQKEIIREIISDVLNFN